MQEKKFSQLIEEYSSSAEEETTQDQIKKIIFKVLNRSYTN